MLIFKNSDGETLATMSGQVEVSVYDSPSFKTYFRFTNGVVLDARIYGEEDAVYGVIDQHNADPGSEYLLVIEDPM